ncbi:MAG: hypothetical protein QOD50_587 [Actinomycetota bacterium]|jgi:hypothetical protein|nr:hypothetical protein [Actinomycetota bacterium]
MPLSEQEQRLLEEMERSLYHNDADFVAGAAGRHGRPTYTRIVTGVLVGVVGVATLIAGVGVRLPVIGVLGFILMFVGVLVALTPPRAAAAPRSGAGTAQGQGDSQSQGRGEQWDNRPDDRDE